MSKLRILITGSQGFVGTYLAREISLNHAHQFDLKEFVDPQTQLKADVTDKRAIERLISAAQPDVIIHLAAIASPNEVGKNQENAWAVNFMGTMNIARAIMNYAPQCHLIWSGSSEAYGRSFNTQALPITEAAPLEPLSSYGATKAAADIMLGQMMYDGLKVTIFRPFNHTGAGQSGTYVVPAFCSQIAKIERASQKPVVEVGNLEAYRDFLHVKDVVAAYVLAALSPEISAGKRYNISTANPIKIQEILDFLIRETAMTIDVKVMQDRYAPNAVATASGDFQALRQDLGWEPQISAFETFREVLNEHRALRNQ